MLPFELTKDTPYLALSGELWSVFYEYFNRNWSCYKGFLLYIYIYIKIWSYVSLTHEPLGNMVAFLRCVIFQHILTIDIWSISYKNVLPSLMVIQHCFRSCLGVVMQQTITWADVDPNLYCHIALLGHSELMKPERCFESQSKTPQWPCWKA